MVDIYLAGADEVMTTDERAAPMGEGPPRPGPPPMFPSKDEFALTYYSGTPVSCLPTTGYRFPCPRKLLTLAQTCRVLDVRRIHTSVGLLLVARRVRVRSHRFIPVVLLLVALVVVLLQPLRAVGLRFSDRER